MINEPNKKDETHKPEQTPADLQMNQNKKSIDADKKSEEQIPSAKQFVKPTEKTSDIKNQPAN
jgi:hypothetical protein